MSLFQVTCVYSTEDASVLIFDNGVQAAKFFGGAIQTQLQHPNKLIEVSFHTIGESYLTIGSTDYTYAKVTESVSGEHTVELLQDYSLHDVEILMQQFKYVFEHRAMLKHSSDYNVQCWIIDLRTQEVVLSFDGGKEIK